MEIFASIIFFAGIEWNDKVTLAFKLFDFDGSKSISEDELFIMCKCFIEAVSLITKGEPCSNLTIKELINTTDKELLSSEE